MLDPNEIDAGTQEQIDILFDFDPGCFPEHNDLQLMEDYVNNCVPDAEDELAPLF